MTSSQYLTGLVGEVRLKVCVMHCVLLVEGAILHGNWKGCSEEKSGVERRASENESNRRYQFDPENHQQRTISVLQWFEITSQTKRHTKQAKI